MQAICLGKNVFLINIIISIILIWHYIIYCNLLTLEQNKPQINIQSRQCICNATMWCVHGMFTPLCVSYQWDINSDIMQSVWYFCLTLTKFGISQHIF
jgi:uncharacterized membrane protein YesL